MNAQRIEIYIEELVLGDVEAGDVEPVVAGLRRELTRLFSGQDLETLLTPDGEALGAALSEALASRTAP
jgi:hypothetical protein